MARIFRAFASALSFVLAASTLAQQVPYTGAFDHHSYNVSNAGFGGYTGSTNATLSIPFSLSDGAGKYVGTVDITYPVALPTATLDAAGQYLLFGSQTVTTQYKFTVTWTRTGAADDAFAAVLDMSTESATSDRPLSTCAKSIPVEYLVGPGSKTYEMTLNCTWNKFPMGNVEPSAPISHMANFVDFTTFGNDSIGGVLGQVYTLYQWYPPLDLSVDRIEMVQVTQKDDNSIPMIADKPTMARVFLKLGDQPTAPVPNVSATLRGYRGGTEIAGPPANAANGSITAPNVPQRSNVGDSLNFVLPAAWTSEGSIQLRAEVDPSHLKHEQNTANNITALDVTFQKSSAFLINYLRVCHNYTDAAGNPAQRCPTDFVSRADAKLQSLYPIDPTNVVYTPLKTPTWYWSRSLATEADADVLITALRKRWELTESVEGVRADQLAAWLPHMTDLYPNLYLGLSDPMWLNSTGRVTFQQDSSDRDAAGVAPVDSDASFTLAHEIGHNLGLRHPNTADACGAKDGITDWPHGNARVQDPGGDPARRYFIPTTKFELMSYCSPPASKIWISPFSYKKLVDSKLKPRVEADAAAPASYLLVSGSAREDATGGSLDPVIPLTSAIPPSASDPSGNHCVRLSGAAGKLADYCFTLDFRTHRDTDLEEQHFVVKVPAASGTSRVSLMRGESELAFRSVSSNPPGVTITVPAAGASLQGTSTVQWKGTDTDGDTLTYTVLYSPDNGSTWIPLVTDTTDSEAQLQTAEMAAGTQILIRVLVTDGYNGASATAGPLTIVGQPVIDVARNIDAGSVGLGQDATVQLHVLNRGEKTLTIQSVTSSNPEFAATGSYPAGVGARGNGYLNVKFTPASPGVRTARLTINSDDPEKAAAAVDAVGVAFTRPQIAVTPTSLDFGSVAIGATKELTSSISNTGSGPLTVFDASNEDSQFRIVSPAAPFIVNPGTPVTLKIQFKPVQTGLQFGSAALTSDSLTSPVKFVATSGTGTGTGSSCYVNWGYPAPDALAAAGASFTNDFYAPKGCTWTAAASASWIVVTSPTTGSGFGVVTFEVKPNSGPPRTGAITLGNASFPVRQLGGATYAVIPAAGSLAGNFNSFFRTTVQLHNPGAAPMSGQIAFRPMTAQDDASDSLIGYRLGPGETITYADLLPAMAANGIGSVDVIPRVGSVPVGTARIFNDGGAAGTSGMTEDPVATGSALEKGDTGVLIAPPEPARARYNIGVRTLGYGATLFITIRDRNGNTRGNAAKSFPASYFIQQKAEDFLGIGLLESDSLRIEVREGSAIVYGAANDNTTQDPTAQFARALPSAATAGQTRIIPAVGSVHGSAGSNFRTAMQIHNASSTAIAGKMSFHPATFSGSASDPSINYSLGPGVTTYYADLIQSFNVSGLGSLDITATTGVLPVVMTRIFNDAGALGTSGVGEELMRSEDALRTGESGIVIASPDPAKARFNIGVRTLGQGASMTITQRNSSGQTVRTVTKLYGPNYFEQAGAATILGAAPGPSDTLTFRVDSGSAIVYGTSNDNASNDPSLQIAKKL